MMEPVFFADPKDASLRAEAQSRQGQLKVPEREIVVRLITAQGEKEATGPEAKGITIQENKINP